MLSARPSLRGAMPGLWLFALLALTLELYWPGLSGPFLLDDRPHLTELVETGTAGGAWDEAILQERSAHLPGLPYRPVSLATFALDWVLSGGDATSRDFKRTNLALHLLCGVLVFCLAGRLLHQTSGILREHRWWIALWVAGVWLLAPLYASTVLYVIQRMAQLAALFSLAAVLAYVAGRQRLDAGSTGRGAALLALCFGVLWPLAFLSKENGALVPVLTWAVELFFFRFRATPRVRAVLRAGYAAFFALGAGAALAVVLSRPDALLDGYAGRDFDLAQRLLTEARILVVYVLQLVAPRTEGMGIYHDDFPLSTGLLAPPATLACVLLWPALLAAAWRLRGRPAGWVLFGPVFFLAGHLAESSVLPLELYFEHRNYLPGFGIFLSAAIALALLAERLRARRAWLGGAVVVLALALPLGYGALSQERASMWASRADLLQSALAAHPDSARLHIDLVNYRLQAGDVEGALRRLDEIEKRFPRKAAGAAMHRLLILCQEEVELPEDVYERLASAPLYGGNGYTLSATALLVRLVRWGECEELDVARVAGALAALLGADPAPVTRRGVSAHAYAAQLWREAGRLDTALAHARKALAQRPESIATALIKLDLHLARGELEAARRLLAALQARPAPELEPYRRRIRHYADVLERREGAPGPASGERRG